MKAVRDLLEGRLGPVSELPTSTRRTPRPSPATTPPTPQAFTFSMRQVRCQTRSSRCRMRASPTGILVIFLYGNPTRSTSNFYRVCFGNEQDGWVHKAIGSRDRTLSHNELQRGLDCNYGEDSDFVRGLPTAPDELQFIERE